MRFGFVHSIDQEDVLKTMLKATAIFTMPTVKKGGFPTFPSRYGRAALYEVEPHTAQQERFPPVIVIWGQSGADMVDRIIQSGASIVIVAFFGEAIPNYLKDAVEYYKESGRQAVLFSVTEAISYEVEVIDTGEPIVRRFRSTK
jgi:hypothetical protein